MADTTQATQATQATVKPDVGFNIVKQAATARASNTQAAIDINSLMDEQQDAFQKAQFAATTVGNSNVVINAAQESWKASSDAKKAEQNKQLGFDPLEAGSKSNYWIQEMHDNAAKSYAALDVVNESRSKTLLNDPLGFIAAQFTLPADVAAQHYYADKYNIAENSLNEIISASNSSSIAIANSQQTTSTATAIAMGEKASAEADRNVAELKANAAGTRIKGVAELNALSQQQADLVFKVHAAQNSDAHLKLAQQTAEDVHAQRAITNAIRQEQLDAKQDDIAGWEAQLANRNAGAKAMGKPTIEGIGVFKREIAQYGKLPAYADMLTLGAGVMMNDGSVSGVPVAENAGNAARNYASAGTDLKGNVAGTYLAQVWNAQKGLATAPKDAQALAASVSTVAIAGATAQRGSIDNSNPAAPNIYQAPIPAVMFKSVAIQSDMFLNETLKPMLELSPMMTITDETMISKAASYAQANPGKAGMNIAAAGIVNYYKQASNLNNSTNRYSENGLPPQVGYIAKIDGRNLDLTSEADVKRAMFMMNTSAVSGSPFVFN